MHLPRRWPTPKNRKARAAEQALYAVCDDIIARRGGQSTDDLLGQLASARGEDGERLDATELRDQVLIFLLAGHETTATALTFALHLLGKHPEQQQRVREEVGALLGDGHRPSAADYNALPQLTCVLKESMRLFPPVPAVGRRSVADCVVGDMLIPAGSAWIQAECLDALVRQRVRRAQAGGGFDRWVVEQVEVVQPPNVPAVLDLKGRATATPISGSLIRLIAFRVTYPQQLPLGCPVTRRRGACPTQAVPPR